MIRGISFEIPQEKADTLWKMLKYIGVEQYTWYVPIDQHEVWGGDFESDFFDRELYNGSDFQNLIQTNHYIIFLKLQAYFIPGTVESLHTYNDFIHSNCQLILLINDCQYVEIYAKAQNVIDSLLRTAKANGYKAVDYITDRNDGRTKMDVL